MKTKDAIRNLFNNRISTLSRREKEYREGLNFYTDARSEFKRIKDKRIELAQFMIDQHEIKLDSIRKEIEELTSKRMFVSQEFAIEGLSNVEVCCEKEWEI